MLKIFLRNAARNKFVTAINVLGLSVGITVSCIIFLFVWDEYSFDSFHPNAHAIYRVAQERNTVSGISRLATTPLALAPVLTEVPGIKSTGRMLRESGSQLVYGNDTFAEPEFCFADSSVVNIFHFNFILGDRKTAFKTNGLIITQQMAKKYFGESGDPIGKIITYRNWGTDTPLEVTAVIEDLPAQSHFRFKFFTAFENPFNLWNSMHGTDWFHSGAWTYFLSDPAADVNQMTEQINQTLSKHLPDELKASNRFFLQPLLDIHLHSGLLSEISAHGDEKTIATFFLIAIIILVIACINYINLTTARSTERAKEIGIRKVMGAIRWDLVKQYMGETIALVFVSLFLSVCLIPILIPLFNHISGKELTFDILVWWPQLIGFGLALGIVSGLYPAFYFSGIRPAIMLKVSKNFMGNDRGWLRKALVITQYSSTTILLISIFVIGSQLNHLQNRQLGFNANGVIYLDGYSPRQAKNLKRELSQLPEVTDISMAWAVPSSSQAGVPSFLFKTELNDPNQRMETYFSLADQNYPNFFNLSLVDGRLFDEKFPADTLQSILINESFVKQAGWEQGALNKEVEVFNMLGRSVGMRKVIGVVKDFHFQSLHHSIKPLAIGYTGRGGNMIMKINTPTPELLIKLKNIAATYGNGNPINIYFLDEDQNGFYQTEARFREIVTLFALIAVVISSIGILGLASYSAQRRSKEIAIRKVLGASSAGIVASFVQEYCTLTIISFVIAVPISLVLTNQWLQSFPYRIDQSAWFYLAALTIGLVLSIITTGFQSLQSARSNPVEVLRED